MKSLESKVLGESLLLEVCKDGRCVNEEEGDRVPVDTIDVGVAVRDRSGRREVGLSVPQRRTVGSRYTTELIH